MKRNLLLLILPIVLFVTSCQKNEYVIPNRTIVTSVSPGNWTTNDQGRTYRAGIDMPEIDEFFNENGAAVVFVSFGTVAYEQIPQVFNGVSYRYTTRPGQIVITIESSNGTGTVNPPSGPMDVKIVLIESQ